MREDTQMIDEVKNYLETDPTHQKKKKKQVTTERYLVNI